MKPIKSALEKAVPKYAWAPIAVFLVVYAFTYYLSKAINSGMQHHDITCTLDGYIPFIPAFIIIYVLAYLQWFMGYLFVCRESKEVCYNVLSANIIAKILCFLIFIIFPTTMTRGQVVGEDIFSQLTNLIYSVDKPNNLLPSIHCLESWILFRTAYKVKKPGRWLKPVWLISALLVFASVVFVKQHVVVDIPAAIIVSEIGIFAANKLNVGRLFEKLNSKIFREGKNAVVR